MVGLLDDNDSEKLPLDNVQECRNSKPLLLAADDPRIETGTHQYTCVERRLSRRGRLVILVGLLLSVVACLQVAARHHRFRANKVHGAVRHDADPNDRVLRYLNAFLDQERIEKRFLSVPSAESAQTASRKFATHPHLAGSSEDFEDAKAILEIFAEQFGIHLPKPFPVYNAGTLESRMMTHSIPFLSMPHAWMHVYYPILSVPSELSVQIIDTDGSVAWEADLSEDGDPGDADAAKYKDAVPAFHGSSKHGEAEGEIIYAGYGTQEDYDTLEAAGANLTGKIVLVRYGEMFRGLKIIGAQERGAIGALVYSDPRDDGAATEDNGYTAYPAGPARNPTSVERGFVQDVSMYPGDPSTPGYPSYENSTRSESRNKPLIPSIPISWWNAQRLLKELGSNVDNRVLNGKSSIRKIKIVNHVEEKVTPIWNAMAAIPGYIRDEIVIIGCHRDAWVMGAADPVSGTVSLHEIIRAYGELVRSGWRPLRTVLFASWDAEEYGMVGSTEYGEDFAQWLQKHVVAYLNIDVSSAGSRWEVIASPLLSPSIFSTAREIPHPTKVGESLWDAREDIGPYEGFIDPELIARRNASKVTSRTGIKPVGSRSDYTVFLQHLGIPSMDQAFVWTLHDAAYHYHSIYDTQRWEEIYGDPGFRRHVAVAQNLGLLSLRIANSIVLPFNTTQYAVELDDYLNVVENLPVGNNALLDVSPLRAAIRRLQEVSISLDVEKEAEERHLHKLLERLRRGFPRRFADETRYFLDLKVKNNKRCHTDLDGIWWTLIRTLNGFSQDREAQEFPGNCTIAAAETYTDFPIMELLRTARRVRNINKKLAAFERGFISEEGIKGREWYKHLAVAPGRWTGYEATTLPALTEALTIEHNLTLAEHEVARLVNAIDILVHNIAA